MLAGRPLRRGQRVWRRKAPQAAAERAWPVPGVQKLALGALREMLGFGQLRGETDVFWCRRDRGECESRKSHADASSHEKAEDRPHAPGEAMQSRAVGGDSNMRERSFIWPCAR